MDSGNLAWSVTATALVLFMTPGVAFFYGGLVKAKSVVSMMMMSFGAMGLVGVLWILYGSNMTVIAEGENQFLSGNPFSDFGLAGTSSDGLVVSAYGATFAIITVALISGAIADRAKFGSWMIFAGIWATVVYFPVAAWVWGGGWVYNLGSNLGLDVSVIDYAGGTAVHINAGAAALALALVLGKRVGFQKGIHKPHNVPLVMLGAAILWFGWFGFNAGAEGTFSLLGTEDSSVGLIVINTLGATAAAIIGWIVIEKIKDGKPTAVGAASGAVAGLVGMPQLFGQDYNYGSNSQSGLGFAGIAVALIGRNNPIGIAFGALLWAYLNGQSDALQINAGVNASLVNIIQGVMVLAVVIAYELVRRWDKSIEQRHVAAELAAGNIAGASA